MTQAELLETGDGHTLQSLDLTMPDVVFMVFKEMKTVVRVSDRGATTVSQGEVVSLWSTMEAAANEINSIIADIGEEEYSQMDESFVLIIHEVKK